MTQTDTVRRHSNGSIDLDFYRSQATALRRQAMRDAATLRKAFAGLLVTMSVLGIMAGIAASPRQGTGTATANIATSANPL